MKIKRRNLNEVGKVIISPMNIITSPAKSGHFNASVGHLFEPFVHMKEEYNRAAMIEKRAKLKANKLCKQEVAFKGSGPGGKSFFSYNWMDRTKFPVNSLFHFH